MLTSDKMEKVLEEACAYIGKILNNKDMDEEYKANYILALKIVVDSVINDLMEDEKISG